MTALGVVVALVVLAAVAAALAVRRLRRPVDLYPGARTGAPLRWRWSLSRAALLHKRLVVAVAGVRLAAASSTPAGGGADDAPWREICDEALTLAAGVDRRLVLADAQPRALRLKAVAALDGDVAGVEQACTRLVGTIQTWAAAAPDRSASALLDRIGAIDAALGEVQAIEAASGVGDDWALGASSGGAGSGGAESGGQPASDFVRTPRPAPRVPRRN